MPCQTQSHVRRTHRCSPCARPHHLRPVGSPIMLPHAPATAAGPHAAAPPPALPSALPTASAAQGLACAVQPPAELPSGMEDEAALLEALAAVPTIARVHAQPLAGTAASSSGNGAGGVQDLWITVS